VLVTGVVAQAFGTNCYVVAPAAGEECLVIDPGIGVLDELAELLAAHRLRPAAVLATHGHLDHVYSITPVCGAHGVAAYLHTDDRYRLEDPLSLLDPSLLAMLEQQFGATATWVEPQDVVPMHDGAVLDLAGLQLEVVHAPGHTEGSVMFRLPGAPEIAASGPAELTDTVLSGDVLFRDGIGRTDLPGGDPAAMGRSLRDKVLPLPDSALVLPGHGPATTMGRERQANQFLAPLVARP
jgi:glyoxylase-like metal-dependent hydrolase (beta-lactamase superfamily II)